MDNTIAEIAAEAVAVAESLPDGLHLAGQECRLTFLGMMDAADSPELGGWLLAQLVEARAALATCRELREYDAKEIARLRAKLENTDG